MQLRLKRSESSKGMLSKTVMFCLDARLELTPDEAENVRKYKLGSKVIYNSEASKKQMEKGLVGMAGGGFGGLAKGYFRLAMSQLQLNITLESLTRGQHIECKDLDEVLDAEQSLMKACENAMTYLAAAATFDGKEEVLPIKVPEPKKLVIVGQAEPAAA